MSNNLVMVIEDSPPVRKLFCTLLKKAGYETAEFTDAHSSIEWLKSNTPLVIVMDILLPDMNGTDLIDVVKEIPGKKDIPIVAVTGFASHGDRERYLDKGFDYYMSKPINTTSFVEEIRTVIK